MGLFAKKKEKVAPVQQVYRMMTEVGNGYYSWNGKLYHSDIIRSCIKPKTKAIGKAIGKHIRKTVKDGTVKTEVNPMVYMRFLLEEPNEYMSGQMLQEKVANQLQLNGNAFILILRDENGVPNGLYPIPAVSAERKYDDNNELYIKFCYWNGRYSEFYYKDLIHIRDDYITDDIFGDSPAEALSELMNTVSVMDQGIRNAIKNSSVIRWLLKFTSSMRDEDLKVKAQEFANNYLDISQNKSVGVAAVDAKADAIQVNNQDYVPNAEQNDRQTQRIYAFFHTNDKIVHSNYNENEWISYYEAEIEPVLQQMSNEYTRRLFSRTERGHGNSIIFESSSLTFASMTTKLQLVQLVDRGIMTPNEVREFFSLAPIDGGDKALLRKDTGLLEGGE